MARREAVPFGPHRILQTRHQPTDTPRRSAMDAQICHRQCSPDGSHVPPYIVYIPTSKAEEKTIIEPCSIAVHPSSRSQGQVQGHHPYLQTLVCPITCPTSSLRREGLSNSTAVSRFNSAGLHLLSPSPKQTHLQVSRHAMAPTLPPLPNTPPC